MSKPKPPKFDDVRSEYWKLFKECKVKPDKLAEVKQLVTQITANRARYTTVATALGLTPWWFVALIHSMESELLFTEHLHNGDRLTARTTHVPAGRPRANPGANPMRPPSAANPYTWEESADDAIRHEGLHKGNDWSITTVLYKLEAFNGWGYRMYHSTVLSAYLWSFTNHYTKGKYGEDKKWDGNLVSAQAGAAAILREMVDSGLVVAFYSVDDLPTPSLMHGYA